VLGEPVAGRGARGFEALYIGVKNGRRGRCAPWVLIDDAGPLSARLVQNGTLKTYKGFPHGMPTTEAETINADLLAFIQS
jgi:hypothetical protein